MDDVRSKFPDGPAQAGKFDEMERDAD